MGSAIKVWSGRTKVQGEEHDPLEQVQGEEHDPLEQVQGEEHDPIEQVQGEEYDPIEQGEEYDPIEQVQGEEHDPIVQGGEEHDPIVQGEEHDPIVQGRGARPIVQVQGGAPPIVQGEEHDPIVQGEEHDPIEQGEEHDPIAGARSTTLLSSAAEQDPIEQVQARSTTLLSRLRRRYTVRKMFGSTSNTTRPYPVKFIPPYGIPVPVTPFPFKLLSPRVIPVNAPVPPELKGYHHVYRHGIRPLWRNPTRFKSLKTPYGFALKIINGDWVPERMMNTFYLGQPIHFQATTNLTIPGTKLFIHSCYATASPASNSTPRYTVIENYGCMVDSKYETCSSHFVPPRTNNTIHLIVDAFQFNTLSPLVNKYYMHCTMVVTSNSMVTQSTKSCHYDKNVNRWVELEGNHSVCSCCDSVCINEDVTLPIGVSKEDREALSPEDDAFDENDYNRLLDVEAEGNDNSDDPNQHLEDTFDASKVPEHSDTENYEGAGEPGHFEEADEWRALSAEEAGGN
ncbi:hypothetical protein HHUSO_G36945 [Huso huso]|uniref:ZP domain-containing protein n=1 Tax=Huso huso TaxID=61971 RepID=A0ABR0Y0T3_HUSHU